jgi:hypothetical protein
MWIAEQPLKGEEREQGLPAAKDREVVVKIVLELGADRSRSKESQDEQKQMQPVSRSPRVNNINLVGMRILRFRWWQGEA